MPTPDGSDDFVGVSGPSEGLRVVVGLVEESVDGGLEIDDRAEDTAFVRAIAVKRSAKSVTAITVVTRRAGDDYFRERLATPGAGACKFGP